MKTMATLPEELIEDILLRLPVRSLVRFKCVCKSWLSLISDPQFAKSHFDLAIAPTYRLLLTSCTDHEAKSVDIEAPLDDDSGDAVFTIPNPSPAPKPGYSSGYVVGSCRGFLLLTTTSSDFASNLIYFVIWNPSTGYAKRFNKVLKYPYLYGFGYDSSTDDYVAVIVALPLEHRNGRLCTEVHCFSLRTCSWSCTKATIPYINKWHEVKRFGSFLNGTLHWLVYSYDHHDDHGMIIAFDVTEKRLSEISLSHDLVHRLRTKLHYLMVMGGCLCLYHPGYYSVYKDYRPVPAEVWTMKEYKVQSSWTKSLVVSTNCSPYYQFIPVCFTKNGQIFGHNGSELLMRINDKGELVERHPHEGFPVGALQRCGTMYRESLLSLPQRL